MPDALYLRLQEFRIDQPGVALTFTRRLARENRWSLAHAERVYAEYLRFLWLAVRAGHPVTPSPDVDQAWHLHLCYTRSYWNELCATVLQRPLHHDPTRGGDVEQAKFTDWYARTLASYRARFGEPPADLWPAVERRFAIASEAARGARRGRWLAAAAAAVLAPCSLASCSGMPDGSALILGLVILGLVGIGLLFVVLVQRRQRRQPRSPGAEHGAGVAACGGKHVVDDRDGGGDGCGGGSGCGGD